MKFLQKSLTKLFVLMFAVSLVFTSCDELTENTKQTINFNADDMHFSIDSIIFTDNKSTTESVVVVDTVLDVNLQEVLEENGYSTDDLIEILVTNAVIQVESPLDFDLHIFQGTALYLGEQQELVAEVGEISDDGLSMTLNILSDNIMNYINNDQLHVVLMMDAESNLPVSTVDLILQTAYAAEAEVL